MIVALRVEHVSKQYRIYNRPGDRLTESLTRGRIKRHREFWALREIGFEVDKGTTTGIVGPNGCGKSTLLQIIAGTLEPTHGKIFHSGRIAALLELGAGFNPEFTGVENIYLNAALMNFTKRETDKLLPQIARFAEIGDFINQPVKTYSSGMHVRLAFAIAASVEPQILVIDEALAVGDAVFQHRCLRRLKEMQEQGATILFVSHDAGAVRALCSRAILLKDGRVIADGAPPSVLNQYQKLIMEREEAYDEEAVQTDEQHPDENLTNGDSSSDERTTTSDDSNKHSSFVESGLPPVRYAYRHGDGSAEVLSVELLDATRRAVGVVETGEQIFLRMRVKFARDVQEPVFGFLIRNRHGLHAYGTNTKEQQLDFGTVRRGEIIEATFSFSCWLGTDDYSISFAVHSLDGISFDWLDGALFFRVTSAILIEGIANLNATATTRRFKSTSDIVVREVDKLTKASDNEEETSVSYG
ncbi:MAG: ABC transporter ATP-binding protein [Pyrinomonadaceae bacterium]